MELTDRTVSDRIRAARVLCIFLMVYSHAWTGFSTVDYAPFGTRITDVLHAVLANTLALSSVPLLSVVSGWLAVGSLQKGYGRFVLGKVETLLIPMVGWNLILLSLLMVWSGLTGDTKDLPTSVMDILNGVFCLTDLGLNVQLTFLRDIFVCMAATPILIPVMKRFPWLVWAGALTWAWGPQFRPGDIVLLRPQILLFFLIGLGLRLHRFDLNRIDCWLPLTLAAYLGVALAGMWAPFGGIQDPNLVVALDLGVRLAATAPFWWLAGVLVSRWRSVSLRLERYVFTLFCTHVIVFKILSVPGKIVFGDYYSSTYWVFFLLQAPIAILASIFLVECMRAVKRLSGTEGSGGFIPRRGSLEEQQAASASGERFGALARSFDGGRTTAAVSSEPAKVG